LVLDALVKATAKIGLGLGMKVIAHDPFLEKAAVTVPFFDGQSLTFHIDIESKETVLKEADFLSLHVPAQKEFVIGAAEIELMKDGCWPCQCRSWWCCR
jgi:D-3-phosphoglycerate dehydrogenase